MKQSNYIEQALRTESIEGAQERLTKCWNVLSLLQGSLDYQVAGLADSTKKYIFYGKPPKENLHLDNSTGHLLDAASISEENIRLLHAGLGMLTEAEEFLQPVLAAILDGVEVDKTNLKEELGDGQWYQAIACDTLDTTFEKEQARNIAKLTARYPEKFTEEAAITRDLDTERGILEDESHE